MRLTTSYTVVLLVTLTSILRSLQESSEGLLSSFCETSSPVSSSLRAARAERRFANYSLCAGKPHVEPSTAAATTLLAAASAWSTPHGQHSADVCVPSRSRGEEIPRVCSRESTTAQSTVGKDFGFGDHMWKGRERAEKRFPCGQSADDRNRESKAKLRRRRNRTTSVKGGGRFVGYVAERFDKLW